MKMTRSSSLTTGLKRLAACGALLGLVAIGTTAAPKPAEAWWAHGGGWGGGYYHGGGWCCGVGIGLYVPPVVVAPAPVYVPPPVYAPAPAYYAPAPAYYAPPQRAWIAGHWQNGYWIAGHWD
jgi:hypothetical protein